MNRKKHEGSLTKNAARRHGFPNADPKRGQESIDNECVWVRPPQTDGDEKCLRCNGEGFNPFGEQCPKCMGAGEA